MTHNTPKYLYKYKSFSVDSLDLLISDCVYYANPTTFNDPLDCNPSIKDDLDDAALLSKILRQLVKDNHRKELLKAAEKIKYKGPKTYEKIEALGDTKAKKIITDIEENVLYFGDPHIESLTYHIKSYLLKNYAFGILSLAKNNDCPLMWSHYADQHKGFCIGYDVSSDKPYNVQPVDYKGKRFITTRTIFDMLFNTNFDIRDSARQKIEKVILLNKATSWKYENEYRAIGKQGLSDSPFPLKDITFGLRFKESAKFSVMRALQARMGEVKFYEMSLCNDSFNLKRKLIKLEDSEFRNFPVSNFELNNAIAEAMKDNSDED